MDRMPPTGPGNRRIDPGGKGAVNAGSPQLIALGQEVLLGGNYADLIAVEGWLFEMMPEGCRNIDTE
jgi:hypothetical protein